MSLMTLMIYLNEEDMNEVGIEDKELLSLLENSVRSNLEHNFLKIFEK